MRFKTKTSHFKLRVFAVAFATIVTGSGHDARAQFCSEPLEPVCLEPSTNFDSDIARTRCVADLELFVERLNNYKACLAETIGNIDGKTEEAAERLSTLADKLDATPE